MPGRGGSSAESGNGVHYFSVKGRWFAYDTASTSCAELDDVALTVLPEILSGRRAGLARKYAHVYAASELRECVEECAALVDRGLFGAPAPAYRHRIHDQVGAVCLHVAHDCNLRCGYCFAKTGGYGGRRRLMSSAVMRRSVDFAFAHSGALERMNIGFFGGEPLMNFPLVREAVAYARVKGAAMGKTATFSLASNAMALGPSIMEFLHRERFSLLFSLDGPRTVHDRLRTTRTGRGSHAVAEKRILDYRRRFADEFTVRGTFTRTTPNFADQVLYLNDRGFSSVSVEPAQLDAAVPHSMTTPGEIARVLHEYDRLADLYVERFDRGRALHFFHFDHVLRKLLEPRPTHTECGAGSGYIAVAPDGSIFPCFETVAEKRNRIGHVDAGFDAPRRRVFQRMHADARPECRACWLKYSCGGGCHAFNIRFNGDISVPYRPHCIFIRHRFKLCAWILAEIAGRGDGAVGRLKEHLSDGAKPPAGVPAADENPGTGRA